MNIIEQSTDVAASHMQTALDLPDEARQTLPALKFEANAYWVSIGFYLGEAGLVRGRPRRIRFPRWQCYVRIPDMAAKHETIVPENYSVSSSDYVGDLSNLIDLNYDQYNVMKREYFDLLAQIFEHDMMNDSPRARDARSKVIARIRVLMEKLREPPFGAYYAHFAREFDAWVRRG